MFEVEAPEERAALPTMTALQQVVADYRTTGMSLRQHPMAFLRGELSKRRVLCAEDLKTAEPDRRCKVAGLVLMRQRPSTAKGITFVTLEDETGSTNLIIRVDVWERFHRVARQATAMLVQGILQSKHNIIHVLVDTIEDLTEVLAKVWN